MKDKIITLLQTIINKIRGLQMTAPIQQEKFADYLEDVIGVVNDADLDVPNELPAVEAADKGKFLHTNESTGALEWSEGGSGGGVLVVTDTNGTLDKTWQEIHDAFVAGGVVIYVNSDSIMAVIAVEHSLLEGYTVTPAKGVLQPAPYNANSADGYPTRSN